MTGYLIDTNVFLQAYDATYRIEQFPGFWEWLELEARSGLIASVEAVRSEIHDNEVAAWVDEKLPTDFFRPLNDNSKSAYAGVAQWVASQSRFVTTAKAEFLDGADPYLIADALSSGRTIVTHEVSARNSKRTIKIPDVCNEMRVATTVPDEMLAQEGAKFVLDPDLRRLLAAGHTV